MPTLPSLLVEVIHQILDECEPNDIVNFALCCKSTLAVSAKHLAIHQKRLREYSELCYTGCCKHGSGGPHPITFLRHICEDANLAWYPRSLKIVCCTEWRPLYNDHAAEHILDEAEVLVQKQDIALVNDVMEEYGKTIDHKVADVLHPMQLDDTEICNVLEQKYNGSRGAMLCLFLLLLPNLEVVDLIYAQFEGRMLGRMLELISKRVRIGDTRPSILSNLARVNFQGSPIPTAESGQDYALDLDSGMAEDFHMLRRFAAMPSVHTLKGCFIKDEDMFGFGLPRICSNVTTLEIQASYVEAYQISDTLEALRGLKSFTYDLDMLVMNAEDEPIIQEMIAPLLEHVGSSVEKVAFMGFRIAHRLESWETCEGCSFKEFVRLRELRFPAKLYTAGPYLMEDNARRDDSGWNFQNFTHSRVGEKRDMHLRSLDILPPSIERLVLDGKIGTKGMTSLLRGFAERKPMSFPRLKELKIVDKSIFERIEKTDWVWEWIGRFGSLGVDFSCADL